MKIFAHRGGLRRAPENTVQAWQQALADGADGFECDVTFTRDKEPVIIHIPTLRGNSISRLVGQPARIDRLSWEDLRKLRVAGQPIPHLNDLLEFLDRQQTQCFIEPKRANPELTEKVVKAIQAHGLTKQVTIIAFDFRQSVLEHSKQLAPNIRTGLMPVSPRTNWPKAAREIPADVLIPGWMRFNHLRLGAPLINLKKKIGALQSTGLPVYGGIANTRRGLEWLAGLGVDGVFTDDVPLAKKVLR